jgi:hypothetical protein
MFCQVMGWADKHKRLQVHSEAVMDADVLAAHRWGAQGLLLHAEVCIISVYMVHKSYIVYYVMYNSVY